MILKIYKPITPSLRFLKQINYKNLFLKQKKLKQLCFNIKRCFGRNNTGKITSYHKGGGCKRIYRLLNKYPFNIGIVEGFEYDPFRSAFLIRIFNVESNHYYYQIAPEQINRGDIIRFNLNKWSPWIGHSTLLKWIPSGTIIHNIDFSRHKKKITQISKSAGTYSQLIQKTLKYGIVKISSGKFRKIPLTSIGTVGRISNSEHQLRVIGKAGRNRWLNFRPITRGVAMNPIDHPHGGGQGKTSSGRPAVSPWGKLTKGVKTRNKNKKNFIIKIK